MRAGDGRMRIHWFRTLRNWPLLARRRLVIFDQAESEMFMLAMDLRKRFPNLDLLRRSGMFFRASRVRHVFTRHEVSVVFHAAAYKHVPHGREYRRGDRE